MDFLTILVGFFSKWGYLAVFGVLVACGFGLPVPEDITLVSGGIISGLEETNTNPHVMFAVGMAGVLFGDTFVFLMGAIYGEKILQTRWVARIVTPERYNKVQDSFHKYGKWVVFFGRFMPGLRMPIYLTAGITGRVSLLLFLFTDFLAAFISVPIWVYLGYFGAQNREWLMARVKQGQMGFLIFAGIAILFVIVMIWMKKRRASSENHKRLDVNANN